MYITGFDCLPSAGAPFDSNHMPTNAVHTKMLNTLASVPVDGGVWSGVLHDCVIDALRSGFLITIHSVNTSLATGVAMIYPLLNPVAACHRSGAEEGSWEAAEGAAGWL